MCKEYKIISYLTSSEIEELADEPEVNVEVETLLLPGGDYGCIAVINGVDGECLCNMSIHQKERMLQFIHDISI